MKKYLVIHFLLLSMVFAADKIAISIKVMGDVTRIPIETTVEEPLKQGTGLVNEDMIRTGKQGFAVAMYLDDKTTIKVRKETEFVVGGIRTEEGINKRVSLAYGTMSANVAKQKGQNFIIATPTSVASVKGTHIVVNSHPVLGDVFFTLTGTIEVTNNVTGETATVNEGENATSTPDGQLDVTTTTQSDVPVFDDDQVGETPTHELRLEIEDPNGNIKEVIIQYQ